MALKLSMDHHVPRAITNGLRLRRVDVLTAYEDRSHTIDDPDLLDRATSLERVLFTQDDDFLVEAKRRQQHGHSFFGVIYAQQGVVAIRQCVSDLEVIALVGERADVENRVTYLSL